MLVEGGARIYIWIAGCVFEELAVFVGSQRPVLPSVLICLETKSERILKLASAAEMLSLRRTFSSDDF